jgi:outer membrane receptor for monomeric catechols
MGELRMPKLLRIAVVSACFFNATIAVAGERPAHRTSRAYALKHAMAADRDRHPNPASPYKADRLAWSRSRQPILDTPGQSTVLTRQVLDDMNATTIRDAMRSTAGVTVGR